HGVTSVVAGNCGFSIAPVRPEHRELLVRTLQHVEDMAPDTLFEGVPWADFETFPQYFDAIERRGTLLNYACYVGHTAVRLYVMGESGYERAANDDDVLGMQRVIADAMAAGAAGFATSAPPTHNGDKGRPGQHRGARRRLRSVAAGVVPPADLPDEPPRALHVQHAPGVPGAHGPPARPAHGGVPRSRVARPRVGGAVGEGEAGDPDELRRAAR